MKPNTPVQPCGKEASHFSKKNLTNKDVYLEYDKRKNDRYGRVLAYVWLDKDTLFNELLVKEGLAKEKYFAPNGKYRDVFIKAQNEAQKKKSIFGVRKSQECPSAYVIVVTSLYERCISGF